MVVTRVSAQTERWLGTGRWLAVAFTCGGDRDADVLVAAGWMRWVYAAGVLVFYGQAMVRGRTFTDVGHFTATLVGLLCYPISVGWVSRMAVAGAGGGAAVRRVMVGGLGWPQLVPPPPGVLLVLVELSDGVLWLVVVGHTGIPRMPGGQVLDVDPLLGLDELL